MKVLHFLDTVGRGGAEMQALDVCRNAKRFGLDLTVVSAGGGALEDDFRRSGVDFIKLDRKFPVDLYLASQLRRIIKDRKIEIVHGYQVVDGMHLYLASRGIKNIKKVLSFQGFIPDKRNRIGAKFLIPRMDVNIAVSRGLQKWLSEHDKLASDSFEILYNGADPGRVEPAGRSLKKELGLSPNSQIFGMIGNFYRDPRKDQITLCKALPEVFSATEGTHCIFVGRIEPGAEERMADCLNFCIDHKIDHRVHFLGARSDVPDILAELDIFVFSSLQEGLPVAVSEAMLARVPMILSDIEPLLEASGDGKYAEVFPVKNEKALAGKILKLLADPQLRVRMADEAREFANEHFSIDAHLTGLKSIYDNL